MERELLVLLLGLVADMEDAPRRPVRGWYTNLDVLAVLLWAALNDRPVSWAVDRGNWPLCEWRRALPSGIDGEPPVAFAGDRTDDRRVARGPGRRR